MKDRRLQFPNLRMKPVRLLWFSLFIFAATILVISIKGDGNERSAFFRAFQGHVLKSQVVGTYLVSSAMVCASTCIRHGSCLSFNIKLTTNGSSVCELNGENRVTCPACFASEPDTTYYEDAEISTQQVSKKNDAQSNYDLVFSQKNLSTYVNQSWSVDLDMVTVCFWMRTNDSDKGMAFSYSLPSALNELTIFKHYLTIHDVDKPISLGTYYDGTWHHACVTWENATGTWKVTVDGKVVDNGTNFQVGHLIKGRGILLVGQDQDGTPGDSSGFQLSQSFMGSLSGMNVWSRVLTEEEIWSMSKTCGMGRGNVLKWSDFRKSMHGDIKVKCPSTCKI